MEITDLEFWGNLAFKTLAYRKNFDLVTPDENIITMYDGMVSELRIPEKKPPKLIGEYEFSVWNIELGKKLGFNLDYLVESFAVEDTYTELIGVMNESGIDLKNYQRVLFIHSLILNKNYRKRGVTEEFIEMLYRDFYSEGVAIITLAKPIQDNIIYFDHYYNDRKVVIRETLDNTITYDIPAIQYYSLDDLVKNDDRELNEYKLFAVAQRCGFERLNDSKLFIFHPEKILKRIRTKLKHQQTTHF